MKDNADWRNAATRSESASVSEYSERLNGGEFTSEEWGMMLSTDLRDTLPPQICALIAGVASEIRKSLEEK